MDITFVLPAPVRVPTGGAAVVLRHASGLAARGHRVRVVIPRRIRGERGRLMAAAVSLRDRWQRVPDSVVDVHPAVEVVRPAVLDPSTFLEGAVIATGIQTVASVATVGRRGWWFVQGDETFVRPDARNAWRLDLRMIPCSTWLADGIRQAGGTVAGVVPNAVDADDFGLDAAPAQRADRVLALYHWHHVKGPETLIGVYDRLLRSRPGIRLCVFAARTPRHRIPDGVEVIIRPSRPRLRELYNRAAVFLHTSEREGWALTPMEAAACGAAVVATASLGPAEYLDPERSMIQTPVGDVDALVRGTLALLDQPERRARLVEEARRDVARFSWPESTDRFEQILLHGSGAS